MAAHRAGSDLTGATVDLLQTLIRNQCVNDGTPDSGQETRNADVLQSYVEGPASRSSAGSRRRAGRRSWPASRVRPGRAQPVPDGPHRRRARAPRRAGAVTRSAASCVTNGDGVAEVWGRGAVDMLNLTSSMAVAFKDVVDPRRAAAGRPAVLRRRRRGGRQRPRRPLGGRAPPGLDPLRLPADRERWAARRPAEAPSIGVTVGEKGVAWRRLRVRGTPGHGSMPFRIDNALVKAAAVVQRLAEYRPAPRFHELWPARVESLERPR